MGHTGNHPKTAVLIGVGMVAKTHVDACLDASEKVHLKGVMSRNADRARAFAARYDTDPELRIYTTVSEIANDPEVDFVIVATPPNARHEIIEPLVAAGKHILLEKPIGRTLDESQRLVDLCARAGATLGVVFQHRARQASQDAMSLIASGTLGALGLAEISVPWWRDQSYYDEPGRGSYARDGGGVLISQAIHTIDLALRLTGPATSVTAMCKTTRFHKMEAEDFVVAGIEFANGAVGSMVASTASYPGGAETVTLHFEKGSLHLVAGQLHVSHRDGTTEILGQKTGTGGGADPMAFTHAWHQQVIENFVAHLHGEAEILASGTEALAAHRFIEAVTRSSGNGTKEYLLP